MTRLVTVVFSVLLTNLPASARRVTHLEEVSLETDTVEDGKNESRQGTEKTSLDEHNLGQKAGDPRDPGGRQGTVAKKAMQEVQRADASFQEVDAHNVMQDTENARRKFLLALKHLTNAIYTEAKAVAMAELSKALNPESDRAQESQKKADAATAMLIDAEASLFEKTMSLVGEAFGREQIFEYMLKGYERGEEKTVERVMERLHSQVQNLEAETRKVGCDPKQLVGLEKLQRDISALDEQAEAMQDQELDSNEIDLTKPEPLEATAMYWGIVKVVPDVQRLSIDLLRKMTEQKAYDESKVATGARFKLSRKVQTKLMYDRFVSSLENMEMLSTAQNVIKKAIEDFTIAKVPSVAAYRTAREQLDQAVKETLERLEKLDPKMKVFQKARIKAAVNEKRKDMENAPH